ncbi:MAG: hypothetical protein Q4B67_03580 [Eubacteriales bacterium]|nr:hypothetical protein [Eubacteriales bacterium]
MNDRNDDFRNLKDDYLSMSEINRMASNLNAIERERERQKNPTSVDYIVYIIIGILMFPVIIAAAFILIDSFSSVLIGFLIFAAAAWLCYIDIMFILTCWSYIK